MILPANKQRITLGYKKNVLLKYYGYTKANFLTFLTFAFRHQMPRQLGVSLIQPTVTNLVIMYFFITPIKTVKIKFIVLPNFLSKKIFGLQQMQKKSFMCVDFYNSMFIKFVTVAGHRDTCSCHVSVVKSQIQETS